MDFLILPSLELCEAGCFCYLHFIDGELGFESLSDLALHHRGRITGKGQRQHTKPGRWDQSLGHTSTGLQPLCRPCDVAQVSRASGVRQHGGLGSRLPASDSRVGYSRQSSWSSCGHEIPRARPSGDSASQELPHKSPLTERPSLPLQRKYVLACWVLAVGAAIVLCSWASRETGVLFHLLYKSLPWGILSAPSPALLSPWIGISGDIPGY